MAVDATSSHNAEAGPSSSSAPRLTAGASPYHESSQFKHWRFSRRQLAEMRAELNGKSTEVVARNQQLEKVRPCYRFSGINTNNERLPRPTDTDIARKRK